MSGYVGSSLCSRAADECGPVCPVNGAGMKCGSSRICVQEPFEVGSKAVWFCDGAGTWVVGGPRAPCDVGCPDSGLCEFESQGEVVQICKCEAGETLYSLNPSDCVPVKDAG